MIEVLWIAVAFSTGMLVRTVGLPPLVGYLAAGFVIAVLSDALALPDESSEVLRHVAQIGVLLLLFTVGLRLNLRQIMRIEILGSTLLHFVFSLFFFAFSIHLLLPMDLATAFILALTLAFSSTVLAAKFLETKREVRAFHGRVVIGILIVQDLIALSVLSVAAGSNLSVWSPLLVLLVFARPLFYRLLDASGRDDLLILFGLLMAVVVGGFGFDRLGLSAELGALLSGALMANHGRARDLSDALWGVKELFLVAFFLQIGLGGLPDQEAWRFALMMLLLLPLKGLLFFFILIAFRLRARSAFLSSISLSTYCEFGLVLASILVPQWLLPLALTVALSFLISAPLNRYAHPLYERFASRLIPFERNTRHPDEQPVSLGQADVLIMGLGRTGTAAYEHLEGRCRLVGLDSDPARVEFHKQLHHNVFFADAEDQVFWQNLDLGAVSSVLLTMNDAEAKIIAARKLRQAGFDGKVLSHSMHEQEAREILAAGADQAYLTMSQAGVGLAEHAYSERRSMAGAPPEPPVQ
ncbi:MAG: cation:proton antiporter [Pseudomonadota bacterium]